MLLIADYQIFSDLNNPTVKTTFFFDFLTFVNNQTGHYLMPKYTFYGLLDDKTGHLEP